MKPKLTIGIDGDNLLNLSGSGVVYIKCLGQSGLKMTEVIHSMLRKDGQTISFMDVMI